MERRQLFSNIFGLGARGVSPVAPNFMVEGGIEPHTEPLTRDDVYHLLRRMGFGATHEQAETFIGKTAAEVVDQLLGLDNEPAPESPGAWVDVWTEDPQGADLQTRFAIWKSWDLNMQKLANWWLEKMTGDETAVEKITLFWTSHWVSEFEFDNTNSIPQMLYRQYLLLRERRLGDLREMALEVTVDSTMLNYLGGTFNVVGAPNENYARELMELFLTGLGWYTEGDVQQAARVLTGWRTQKFSDEPAPNDKYISWFDAAKHDTGAKQFMGQTIPARTVDNNTSFQVKNEEVLGLINIIFDVRPEAVSAFIAEKAYRFFIYSSSGEVDPDFINELAEEYRNSNFNLRALFRALFTSKHFYAPEIRGVQIKTPIEYITSFQRQLGQTSDDPQLWALRMDQHVMDPPNVSGWPGYRSWISTNTYPVRRQFARHLIDRIDDTGLNIWIKKFDEYDDVYKFVAGVVGFLLPVDVSQERMDFYVASLLQAAPDYDWPLILDDPAAAAARTRNLLITISKAPDFQLC